MRYSQKMRVNGTYLEDLIPGYQTLEVKGREDVDMDISSMKVTRVDGERFQYKRKKARTLQVKYMIRGMGPDDFEQKYDRLKAAMKVSEAQLIFDDDPGRYWLGTPEKVSADFPGQSVSTGTIEITCHDPNKYALVEKTVSFVDGEAEIYYSGTEETYPSFKASVPATNGFVSFTMNGSTLLFGDDTDPGDEDAPVEPDPDALIEYTFTEIPSTSEWSQNTGYLTIGNNPTVPGGTLAISGDPVGLYGATFGSTSNRWHGPTITRAISKEGGKVDCSLTCHIGVEVTANKQCGRMQILLSSGQRNVAALSFYKNGTGSKNGAYTIYVNGSAKKEIAYSMAAGNKVSGSGGGTVSITKQGGTITFNVSGTVTQINDSALENVGVTEFTITFTSMGSSAMLNRCRLYSLRFTSPDEGGGEHVIIEHAFHAGDVLEVDCSAADTRLNNITNHALGNVRNPWENMKLTPGLNVIAMDSSEWADSDPTATITYREVFT